MTHNEMIRVLEAHRDGRRIEARELDHAFRQRPWMQVTTSPDCRWQFDQFEYRIKPEPPPKPREWWIYPVANNMSCSIETSPTAGFVHVREVIE